MEKWQKDHLRRHRVELLDNTICNEPLLSYLRSENVLANADVASIKAELDQYAQVARLYDIVVTRQNGFMSMARALCKLNQTGAYRIFIDGLKTNIVPELRFNFQGKECSIHDFFNVDEVKAIIQNIIQKGHMTSEQYLNLYDRAQGTSESRNLVNDTLPGEIPFYIPRSLMRRVNVRPQLFYVDCSDIFVFKGADGAHLARLLQPNRVAPSTDHLLIVSARFIYLVNDQDWDDIHSHAQDPVHLIICDPVTEKYMLEATSAGSKVLYHFLEKEHDPNKSITTQEDEFMTETLQSEAVGVCICDVPGMGKTLLLSSLARKMKQLRPESIVVFIQMSYFLDSVVTQERRAAAKRDQHLDQSLAKKVLIEYITPYEAAYCILTKLLNKTNIRLELFLDGFDEVRQENFKFAKKLLAALPNALPNISLFVTSRPHIRHELESAVKVISYDILPFNEKNQVDFLRNYWGTSATPCNQEKLLEYSTFCIKQVKKSLNEKEAEITGIPLQCRLVAEVFKKGALTFAAVTSSSRIIDVDDVCNIGTSLSGLYKMYMDLRFKEASSLDSPGDVKKCTIMTPMEFQKIKEYHIVQALRILFPDCGNIFCNQFGVLTAEMMNLRFSAGLLQRQFEGGSETVEFAHRTFAEYLVAEFFAGALANSTEWMEGRREKNVRFLFDKVIKPKYTNNDEYVFGYPVVVYFLNSICLETTSSSWDDDLVVSEFVRTISANELYSILCACIRGNHTKIIVLLDSILSRMGWITLWLYKSGIIPWVLGERVTKLLSVSAKYSSLSLVNQLCNFLHDKFSIDVDDMCNKMSGSESPLNSACRKLDFEMVQFFAHKIPSAGRKLLEDCVKWSLYDTPAKLDRRVNICKLLLYRNENLIKDEKHILLSVDCVHVEVIKFLIKNGLDPMEARDSKNLVHKAAQYMVEENFHELCLFLIPNYPDLFTDKQEKWNGPIPEILANSKISMDTISTIFQAVWTLEEGESGSRTAETGSEASLFQMSRVSLNSKNSLGRSLLICAAEGKRDVTLMRSMIQKGADVMIQDEAGDTFAHYISLFSSREKYHDITQMLIEEKKGAVFLIANKKGETPLHWALKYLELLPKTLNLLCCGVEEVYVDLNAVDNDGLSILHWAVKFQKDLELVTRLVDLGADWKVLNKNKCNLTHYSASLGLLPHLNYFHKLGCSINETDNEGNNALQCASSKSPKNLKIIECLCTLGVNKHNVNNCGKTAYEIAIENNVQSREILQILQ